MKNFLNKYRNQLIIFGIVAFLFWINYKTGTYLTGWDNLQTELYPSLAVKRAFFGVWQEYQSFGLLAGMAHASDLVRSVFLWLASYVIPQNMIRYFYHFLLLLIGGLGMYQITGFWGSLFYLLNFGTIQIFYVPFEPFSAFFAFLPWEVWIFRKCQMSKFKSQNLVLFFIINLLATPQAYLQTLFVVYFIVLICFFSVKNFKKSIFLLLLILVINSFWILPEIYFLKTSGSIVKESKINQLATEEIYYQNREKGTLDSFIKMQGFYYDLFDSRNNPLFLSWKTHFNSPFFSTLPYVFALIMVLGIVSIIKNKRDSIGFLFLFTIVALVLFDKIGPLRQIEFINQIFRSPFTKFIIPYAFVASYLFAVGIDEIKKIIKIRISILFFLLIVLHALPAFQGYLFSPTVSVKIPDDYLNIMNYFKTQDRNQRIALLPDYTYWGWFRNSWGYDGSGFLWYGIEQPMISRTFDVWSHTSESYFWEIKNAIEMQDQKKFNDILHKYDINYLLLDKSLLPIASTYKGMQYDQLENIIKNNTDVSLLKKGKFIDLYRLNVPNETHFLYTFKDTPNIGPKIKLTNEDSAYFNNGNYISGPQSEVDEYYPFLDLMSQTRINNKKWKIKEVENNFILTTQLDINPSVYDLQYPKKGYEALLNRNGKINAYSTKIAVSLNNKQLIVSIPKTMLIDFDTKNTLLSQCSLNTQCFGYDGGSLEQRYSYIIRVQNENIQERRLFFYILDKTKEQAYLEDRLKEDTEYYIIPPKYQYGVGYNFSFRNNSYDNITSKNKLTKLVVYLFPFDQLKEIKFVKKNNIPSSTMLPIQGNKIFYFLYQIPQVNADNQIITLSQSYHEGWKAWQNGNELDHVTVNGWANGWRLRQDSGDPKGNNIVIIFWPQYLEYVGFILLAISFSAILFIKEKHE